MKRDRTFWMSALFLALIGTLGADPNVWTGGIGDWNDVLFWSDGSVPVALSDDVLIDGDPAIASSVSTTLTNTAHTAGVTIVDEGDSLTMKGKAGGSSSSYTGITFAGFQNAGNVSFSGGSSSKSHGNSFVITVNGPATNFVMNTATGVIEYKGISNYRRGYGHFYVPGHIQNDGVVKATAVNTQNGGYVNFRLYTRGEDEVRYIDNGETWLFGRGGGTVWCCLTTIATNKVFALDGTGTVYLASGFTDAASLSMIGAGASGVKIVNEAGHTVAGSGNIGHSGSNTSSSQAKISLTAPASVTNKGAILARRLVVDDVTSSVDNLVIGAGSCAIGNAPGARIVAGEAELPCNVQIGGTSGAGSFVNEGLLEAGPLSEFLFSSNMTASVGGELRGTGTFRFAPRNPEGTEYRTLELQALVRPGDSANGDGTGASGVGTLRFGSPVAFGENAVIELDLLDAEEEAGVGFDSIAVEGECSLGGTVRVVSGDRDPAGKTFRILTCAPGLLVDNGVECEPYQEGRRFLLAFDVEAGTVDAVFPPSETLFLIR